MSETPTYERSDISILVVEYNLGISRVFQPSSKRRVHGCAPRLGIEGYDVELVWSVSEHQFEDFRQFRRKHFVAIRDKIRRLPEDKRGDRWELYSRLLECFKYLRQTPINDPIEDLSGYDFIIAHYDNREADIMNELRRSIPSSTLIVPGAKSDKKVVPKQFTTLEDNEPKIKTYHIIEGEAIESIVSRLIPELIAQRLAE